LARPDLVVTNASVGSITRNVNGTYTLSVTFSVQNSGTVTAQPNWYDMAYLSADAVLDNADQQLAGSPRRQRGARAGQSYTATGTFTTVAFTPAGNYTLFIKADGHGPTFGNGTNTDPGDLIEANDANNARGLSITLP
jgi:hypothetical protein